MKPLVTHTGPTFEQERETEHFHGAVLREHGDQGPQSPHLRCSFVRFEGGAFTKLHHHTGGQVLWVTKGDGFVEFADGERHDLKPGTRVVIPPGELHRHGAKPKAELEHLAVTAGETHWWTGDPGLQTSEVGHFQQE